MIVNLKLRTPEEVAAILGKELAVKMVVIQQLREALSDLVVHDLARDDREATPNCLELQEATALLTELDQADHPPGTDPS